MSAVSHKFFSRLAEIKLMIRSCRIHLKKVGRTVESDKGVDANVNNSFNKALVNS